MVVTIESNGSKWAGSPPDSIEVLLGVLARTPLDPRWKDYGGFIEPDPESRDGVFLHGNFLHVSHGFRIRGPRAELQEVIDAIEANQRTPAYAEAERLTKGYKPNGLPKDEVRS